jgi:hypothetical protein
LTHCTDCRTPAEQGGYNSGYGYAAGLKARALPPHQQAQQSGRQRSMLRR